MRILCVPKRSLRPEMASGQIVVVSTWAVETGLGVGEQGQKVGATAR